MSLAYAVLAALWIALSDTVLSALVPDPVRLSWLQTFKGWFFVSVTSLLFYLVVRWQLSQLESARMAAQAAQSLSESLLDSLPSVFFLLNTEHRLLRWNQQLEAATGFSAAELAERSAVDLTPEAERPMALARLAEVMRVGTAQGEWPLLTREGRKLAHFFIARRIELDGEACILGLGTDVSELQRTQGELAFLSSHDSLTQLPNRLLVRDRCTLALSLAARENQHLAIMVLDLDHFKIINDTLGHRTGDLLLQAITDRLLHCLQESDTLSRQGGDEFLVVLTGVHDMDSIASTAQEILQGMEKAFQIGIHALSCSFSIGIAVFPEDGSDFDTLLLKADTAMYHAKQVGRNTYRFFTERMNADAHERLHIQNCLRHAIERQQLQLHYQPQVELSSGRVTGAEALLRWNCPELGQVAPDRFIPIAEESGLIIPIGEWVLREACQQAQAWRQAGRPPLVVAVNMSALQFRRSDPVALVSQVLAETRLPASCLELELTESLLVENVEEVLETLERLKALGGRLSIDDFGTGYSSLSYLKRFPIDKLKIDRAFVRDVAINADDAAIVNVIINLGHTLQLSVIAEGVEDTSQLDSLIQKGCDNVQGYLFGRPMPAHQFASSLGTDGMWEGAPSQTG